MSLPFPIKVIVLPNQKSNKKVKIFKKWQWKKYTAHCIVIFIWPLRFMFNVLHASDINSSWPYLSMVFTNIKENEFLSTNRKSPVVVNGDGNVK
jgi:hypothetical protein